MKLHQSTVIKNLDRFPGDPLGRLPRECNDIVQMWKVCKHFQPKSFLEIGFSAGQTFGLFLESTDDNTRYVSVDKNYINLPIFEEIFKDCDKRKQIEFIHTDSMDLEISGKFDFILIDGNHDYEYVLNDLKKCLPLLHKDTILCMDDSLDPGVDQTIREHLLGQHDFVPFLAGSKQIFFHHCAHSVEDFLNSFLVREIESFMCFFNFEYNGFNVFKTHVPQFIEDHKPIFVKALETYDI
jgi:hypothetical protein